MTDNKAASHSAARAGLEERASRIIVVSRPALTILFPGSRWRGHETIGLTGIPATRIVLEA
jgi:hypothetical protein